MPTGRKPKPGALSHHIAGVLRAEKARQRISQVAIAEATGISQSQVSKLLAAKVAPTVDELVALCRVLGLGYLDVNVEAERRFVARMDISPEERAALLDEIARNAPESHGSGRNSSVG